MNPSTGMVVRHCCPSGRLGHAASVAIALRYGPISTVIVVVMKPELAQSYQNQARWCGVIGVLAGAADGLAVWVTGEG